MENIWASVKKGASVIGHAAGQASLQTKLRAEIMLTDREIKNRQSAFGVQLYDYVAPLAKHPSFYSSDDTLTTTLQPPFITAQREIAALEIKAGRLKEKLNLAGARRAATCTPASNWQQKITNAGKSTALAGEEAKISTEISMVQNQITRLKQEFGQTLYQQLEKMEDTQQWLPTDREIRSYYDNCRRDVDKIKQKKVAKEKELEALGGGGGATPAVPQVQQPPDKKPEVPPWGSSDSTTHSAYQTPQPQQPAPASRTMPWTTATAPAPIHAQPTGYQAPIQAPMPTPTPAPAHDPYNENNLFDFVPMQTPMHQMGASAPVSAPPAGPTGTVYDPFAAPPLGSQSQSSQPQDDPFAGLF